jgi:hypothetical protein
MDKFFSLTLFFWLLETDNNIQELVSKTHQCDCKVNDHGFTHNFRSILWIGKLCSKIEFKWLIVVNEIISEFDVFLSSSVNNIFLQQWINGRIKLFVNILEQACTTSSDCVL